MIKRLQAKFILINMILITIVLAVTFAAVYVSTQQRLIRDSESVLQRAINDGYQPEPLKDIMGPKRGEPDSIPASTLVVRLDAENNIIEARGPLYDLSDEESLNEIVQASLTSEDNQGIIENADLRYLKENTPSGTKIAFIDRSNELRTLSSLTGISLLVGIGSLGAFFLISLYLGRWALRPVERAWEQQKQFVADASHELKTPLAVILANADIVLSHRQEKVQNQAKWIEYIKTEALEMSTLVENLLFLAKTDDAKQKVVLSRINLSDTVLGAVLPFESVIYEQDKKLESDIEPDLCIVGDESKLKQLIGILLDNACKYSNERGTISVKLSGGQDCKVMLSVSNTGTHIQPDQVEHIFERFFRVDKSRAREKGGYGLGLSIAQSIASMHNAAISVDSSPEYGTTFTVTFASA